MGIILFITLLIGAVLLTSPAVKGSIGEGEVRHYLRKLDTEKYKIFHDTLLPSRNGGTTQIDHIVVSRAGIFVIETKNYKGWIFGNERSRQWTQTIYRRKQKFNNPLHQNYGHIKAIEHILGEQKNIPYYNVVVFGSRAVIKGVEVNSPNTYVVSIKQLLLLIENHKEMIISDFHMKGIGLRLQSKELTYKGASKEHKGRVRKEQEQKKEQVNKGICPKCGGQIVDRTSKKNGSTFKGCSNFPKCRFNV
ncbi:NERD domain-containing protein [Rossellomorea aquimaris]|uniref:NERD domain-containing protein n=1 Tax=Rossellomorea aquimaris TaxID=189382 RepID=UPI0009F9A88D|nr:NERD domain-containing protein [Rossellomorea aquimaris]